MISGFNPDPRPFRRPDLAPSRETVVGVEEYRIHTREYGSGIPLILLHGLSGSARWWSRNIPAFAAEFRVLVPDLLGFGRTRVRGPIPPFPELSAVLTGWMDRLGLERANLVGHSMGGQIAVHLAARFPERVDRLVLVDPAGIPRPLTPRNLMRFARETAPPSRWGDPRFIPVIMGDALIAGPASILRALYHMLRDDIRPLLPQISAPTLVVWGERDSLIPVAHARDFQGVIPGARLSVISGAAHNPMVDAPEAFNEAVLAFLREEAAP